MTADVELTTAGVGCVCDVDATADVDATTGVGRDGLPDFLARFLISSSVGILESSTTVY